MTRLRAAQQQDKRQQPHTGTRETSKIPREDVEPSSLQILKTGQDPAQPDLSDPALSRGLD